MYITIFDQSLLNFSPEVLNCECLLSLPYRSHVNAPFYDIFVLDECFDKTR